MGQSVATIREIAKILGISPSTVSRALHDHPRIGLRTKNEVKKLAAELNYEPNQQAIAFKQRKTFTLGVILPELKEEFFALAINGIEDIVHKNNYIVFIGQSHDDEGLEKRILKGMFEHRVDGLLVSISKGTSDISHFSKNKYNIPVVFFDRVPDVAGIHSVWCNLRDSTVQAVNLLVTRRHRKIGFIQGPPTLNIRRERLEGYQEGLRKNNLQLDPACIVTTDLSSASTFMAMRTLMALPERPSAVIAFNDSVALDAILFCKENNLKINKDISFVSYANWPVTHYLDSRPMASIEQFPYEQGSMAASLLFRLMDRGEYPEKNAADNLIIESKLIINA